MQNKHRNKVNETPADPESWRCCEKFACAPHEIAMAVYPGEKENIPLSECFFRLHSVMQLYKTTPPAVRSPEYEIQVLPQTGPHSKR